ncbi:zinc finger MYM-type protein 1-like [Camellia sinensis]|uniref:zinc finger MYM-type protein 1-like n=1 Tax=Camellia sinensis TaxID=4442 RepID=UPI0010368470|nr:zinc finger MYM-type protein 1-like [Camellia sinensis]
MKNKLQIHVGGVNSAHNQTVKKCEDLMKQKQHIQSVFLKQSNQEKIEYRAHLNATVDCIRFLLRRGLAFRGHDESDDSSDKGNFLELLQFLADHNESINKVVLGNTPKNNKLTHHDIQKDIVNAAACKTINAIIKDLDNEFFSILVDESRDISVKEQMAVVLRYVDKKGIVIERFLGIVHVSNTTALSLKATIESLFCRHGLSISKLRGQGYDGATNMQGEFNGLKALILRENESAFYVHYFAYQLQLTLVAVAKKHIDVAELFCSVANIVNVVGGSCKRRDALRDAQFAKITEALDNSELRSGRGLNQETSLKCAGDTRWGSHFGTIINLILMFSSSINVLEIIEEDGLQPEQRVEARSIMKLMLSFEFAFTLYLMKNILGITNELSLALQKKNQDIVNAMTLVKVSKQ